ncbi:MAG: hypothetical protein RL701_4837 [Pseudomonadota bacterium]
MWRRNGLLSRTGRGTAVAVWTLAIAFALLALAVTAKTVTAEDAADARIEAEYQQVINDALTEYERGGWEESAALFARAHELLPSARTLRGMGLAAFETRRYPECIRYLTSSLTDPRRPLTALQRDEIEATLRRARLYVAYVKLAVTPADATVAIDGQEVKPDDSGVVITNSGWIDVEMRAEGYETQSRRLRVNPGDRPQLAVQLVPTASAAPVPTDAPPEPPGEVALASEAARTADAVVVSPPPWAAHEPASTSGPYGTWKWLSSAGALAALGTGATLLIMQKSQAPGYRDHCVNTQTPAQDCKDQEQLLSDTLWTGSIVGFSLGAGLTALSVVLFTLDSAPARTSARDNAWACAAAGAIGVACRVHF